jgi:hypothetical protein
MHAVKGRDERRRLRELVTTGENKHGSQQQNAGVSKPATIGAYEATDAYQAEPYQNNVGPGTKRHMTGKSRV